MLGFSFFIAHDTKKLSLVFYNTLFLHAVKQVLHDNQNHKVTVSPHVLNSWVQYLFILKWLQVQW